MTRLPKSRAIPSLDQRKIKVRLRLASDVQNTHVIKALRNIFWKVIVESETGSVILGDSFARFGDLAPDTDHELATLTPMSF